MPTQTKLKNAQLLTPVTNGDAHDHLGGDGGTIALSSLSGSSDNVTEGATNKYITAPNLRATIITPVGDTAPTDSDIFAFSQTVGGNLKKSLFSTLKTFLRANFDTVYAAIANGVTNGDSHDHLGGDGGTVAYSSLSGRPTAETNANDIFFCPTPGGPSAFVGTINGAPSGTSVTYNVTSGQEGAMSVSSSSQIGKVRLYNTTRGTSALISSCNTATNVITLTATAPVGWVNGDTITIASQTVSGGGFSWIDVEITSGLTGKSYVFVNFIFGTGAAGDNARIHPFEASHSSSKYTTITSQVASVNTSFMALIKLTGNVFSLSWTGTAPTNIVIREAGYLE